MYALFFYVNFVQRFTHNQGGNPGLLQQGVQVWLHTPGIVTDCSSFEIKIFISINEVSVGQWTQTKVAKVAPVTALLDKALQAQLAQLYNSLITYPSLSLDDDMLNDYFDDSRHALKTLSTVTVFSSKHQVRSLYLTYLDGTSSGKDEENESGVESHTFELKSGEKFSSSSLEVDRCYMTYIRRTYYRGNYLGRFRQRV